MPENPPPATPPTGHHRHSRAEKISETIGKKESRKLKARTEDSPNLWFFLGMMGLVGWAVSIPTVIGALIGWWLDTHWPQRFSWTLMLMLLGLIAGCILAWRWVVRQRLD